MSPQRIRIPTLRQLIGDINPMDFRRPRSPLSERRITPEDLDAGRPRCRPDLVPIVSRSVTCPLLRMTRRKVFSGRIRKG